MRSRGTLSRWPVGADSDLLLQAAAPDLLVAFPAVLVAARHGVGELHVGGLQRADQQPRHQVHAALREAAVELAAEVALGDEADRGVGIVLALAVDPLRVAGADLERLAPSQLHSIDAVAAQRLGASREQLVALLARAHDRDVLHGVVANRLVRRDVLATDLLEQAQRTLGPQHALGGVLLRVDAPELEVLGARAPGSRARSAAARPASARGRAARRRTPVRGTRRPSRAARACAARTAAAQPSPRSRRAVRARARGGSRHPLRRTRSRDAAGSGQPLRGRPPSARGRTGGAAWPPCAPPAARHARGCAVDAAWPGHPADPPARRPPASRRRATQSRGHGARSCAPHRSARARCDRRDAP